MYVCMYVYVCVCVCVHVCMCVYVCICVCMYIWCLWPQLGADHWRVGAVLRVLAGEYRAKGDPISSEGLYRSAVSRLDVQPRVAHVEVTYFLFAA